MVGGGGGGGDDTDLLSSGTFVDTETGPYDDHSTATFSYDGDKVDVISASPSLTFSTHLEKIGEGAIINLP